MYLKITTPPSKEVLKRITAKLDAGGIIVYPTETTYGIGCNAFDSEAVAKVYAIKDRKMTQPVSVLVDSLEMVQTIAELNPQAEQLIKRFYPGPLVISLPKKTVIPDIVNATGIAFRISSNEIATTIVRALGKPLVTTSANKSGESPPYSIEEVLASLERKKLDIIIDSGKLPKRAPSTLIDFQLEPSPKIIREGDINKQMILDALTSIEQ